MKNVASQNNLTLICSELKRLLSIATVFKKKIGTGFSNLVFADANVYELCIVPQERGNSFKYSNAYNNCSLKTHSGLEGRGELQHPPKVFWPNNYRISTRGADYAHHSTTSPYSPPPRIFRPYEGPGISCGLQKYDHFLCID